jgi:hypothetical protein
MALSRYTTFDGIKYRKISENMRGLFPNKNSRARERRAVSDQRTTQKQNKSKQPSNKQATSNNRAKQAQPTDMHANNVCTCVCVCVDITRSLAHICDSCVQEGAARPATTHKHAYHTVFDLHRLSIQRTDSIKQTNAAGRNSNCGYEAN